VIPILVSVMTALLLAAPAAEPRLPVEAPGDWLLSFIDVETTGLVPGHHEMIDIGVVLSTLDGDEVARTFIRVMPDHPERTSPEVPAINGFDVEKWRGYGALSSGATVDSLLSFYAAHTAGRHVIMVAYNSKFDAAFLDHLFRSAGHDVSEIHYYYVLDLPSMAWALGMRDLWGSRVSARLGIPDEPHTPDEHTGITGADLNHRIYRELMRTARSPEAPAAEPASR